MKEIISTANPKIKWLRSLHKHSTRRTAGVFLVEGAKEITAALDGGYQPKNMFICPEIYGAQSPVQDMGEVYTVNKPIFEKISYRSGSDGLVAVFQAAQRSLSQFNFGDNPFFIVVESLEKPGNLGAIIRTADGAGADGVIVCDPRTDIFNPNVIRASLGTVFSKQVVVADNSEVYDFLEKHEITAYGALITPTSKPYTQADFTLPLAVVLGAEHAGLSAFWQDRAQPVIIPMHGSNDSLNVSNAAAVLAYEVIRQRHEA